LTLVAVPGTTLVSLVRLLNGPSYRQEVVAKVSDPWCKTTGSTSLLLCLQAPGRGACSDLDKVGAFVSSPLLRNLVGQAHSRLQLRAVMDEGKILLINLSKGRMGDDASSLLGSFLVTGTQIAAMSRADTPRGAEAGLLPVRR